MPGATEQVKRSSVKRFLADGRTGKLKYELHSLAASIAVWLRRVLNPCGARADTRLVDGLELKAFATDAQEVSE